ncbi:nucleotidyltransferase domain-containing protein [Halovibrio sp. HP20-50]|uniref:nucleotidyltransferase domain-containing protein n=1 Tax=Halovibrio sp. HP20-59 TaxID=3080275 RepID=UPI00294AA5D0|nr:nucleotidyltransferase domain-containing protein [Halovibrio sp. HP20-59]MEA2119956.1 nucleotidyltransferase domain-containing protein [Halovibrio sp. HP20-59]
MRITQTHRAIILSGVSEFIGDGVETHVFGSRLDDSKRGGGIDLLLTSKTAISPHACDELKGVLEEYLKLPVAIITYASADEPSPTQASVLAEARPIG